MMNENNLIENKDARNEMLHKVEVLDKVKELMLLPGTDLMTTKMVAEWFEVEFKTVEKTVQRHREELTENGFTFKKYSDIKHLVNSDNMSDFKISRQGSNVFSKRAVLNIAMLLRDSEIAQRVRTALLDQQEVMTDEQKTMHIDKEKELALKIMFASNEGEKMLAFNEYNEYKNRHIKQLEETIEIQKPKAKSFDVFINASNYQKMNDVAKSLGVGRNNLFKFLREQKVLMNNNTPYQTFIERGYFIVKEKSVERGEMVFNTTQTYVTAKGVNFIHNLLSKSKEIN